MGLYLLDYGAGNVQSLANTLKKLGHEFQWISSPADFHKATSLIFPGVGAFGSAIDGLISRGLYEPLREYIASGKPYFGICIGMQVLFRSSLESPSSTGLGIIPSDIGVFTNVDKSVPHMGWNSVEFLDPAETAHEGLDPSASYYFVHSFRAAYEWERPEVAQWAHSTTQYGQEVFLATVRKGNVFACQFHPEKSGQAGLRVLDAWLRSSESERATSLPTPRVARHPKPKDGFTKRIIACMDVRSNDDGDLVVTKGDQYDVRERTGTDGVQAQAAGAVRNLGKPVALAARYYEEGADELCLMNITSFRHSPLLDQPMLAVVRAAAETVYVPLTIGGGIKDTVDPDGTPHSALEVAGLYFRAGADKVSIATEAVFAVEKMRTRPSADGLGEGDGTSAIETIAQAYGRQAVVVSVDPRRVYVDPATYDGPYKDELVFGKPDGPGEGARQGVVLVKGVEKLGAGEILLNSIDRDGTGLGYDLDLVALVRRSVRIPVVASSGAGRKEHFVEVFEKTGVEAALAAGIFHRREVGIDEVKEALAAANINVRTA
ncbi:hypothetical protein ONZ51_g1594 [Trametes cubensis]|uniref:Glutamine amidotransferase domain-containing protein n=1 Tax=Trametes cubensis TaxID=1111947 RepID=A0AAD7U3G8_9APHY|nr:hypothetical protein ONZ51_g1594 [Trametes cubensis]